jgi:hypothetical protein
VRPRRRRATSSAFCPASSRVELVSNTKEYQRTLFTILLCGISYSVVFIESRPFTRRLMELAGDWADDVLRGIQGDLLQNPERGRMVKGLGGIRKARSSHPARGKGKRGGFRFLYLYLEHRNHIHLLFLLAKDEQEDLNEEQRKVIRRMVAEVRGV